MFEITVVNVMICMIMFTPTPCQKAAIANFEQENHLKAANDIKSIVSSSNYIDQTHF